MQIRLDKFLSETGFGTRSEVKKKLKTENVQVDGIRIRDAAFRFDADVSTVTVNGEPVRYSRFFYYMLNKPAGVVSATKDPNEKTVVDLIPHAGRQELFPVGRLDKDTTGLLLITNDGQLSHRLLSPKHHVEKTYLVTYRMLHVAAMEETDVTQDGASDKAAGKTKDAEDGEKQVAARGKKPERSERAGILPRKAREMLERGVDIGDDSPTRPARLTLPVPEEVLNRYAGLLQNEASSEGITAEETKAEGKVEEGAATEGIIEEGTVTREKDFTCLLTITEGRYHQVKRMFAAVGAEVTALARLSMGHLSLDPALPPGAFRPLTEGELSALQLLS